MVIPAIPFLPPSLTKLHCVSDARQLARRRLPKLVFDYVDGAAGIESSALRNEQKLAAIELSQRALVNVDQRSLDTHMFERQWKLPFGIAPMGMCKLSWPGGDDILADAARANEIPIGLSTAASSSIEHMCKRAGDNLWFQLYVGQSIELGMELVERARNSGCQTLILTIDVPVVAARIRDQRNGFKAPLKIGPKQFLDFALHPEWSLRTLKDGAPTLANFDTGDDSSQKFNREEGRGKLTWDFLAQLRKQWKGKLVIKGISHVDDAKKAMDYGVDAIYVSNHGGRQLDAAPASITQLIKIRQTLGPDATLFFDSGVRSGDDIVRALACGADFVFLGRPFLYAMAANGACGLQQIIDVLAQQTSTVMAQCGVTSIADISSDILVPEQRNLTGT